jgi:probable HAF family extracellular repeat protein
MHAPTLIAVLTLTLGSVAVAHESRTPPRYRLTTIEDARAGIRAGIPRGLNNRGFVTGEASGGELGRVAYLWRNKRLIELQGDDVVRPFEGLGLNDRGQVVGIGLVADSGTTRIGGFVWTRGKVTHIGYLPGDVRWSVAYDINEFGQVAGQSETAEGRQAVLWENGNLMPLGDLPGGQMDALGFAINDRGTVVGEGTTELGHYAMIWRGGVMRQLPVPANAASSFAFDVNNFNVVAGYAAIDGLLAPMLWRRGRAIRLPLLSPGYNSSYVSGINDFGDAVGVAAIGTSGVSAATLWRHGRAYNLNELIAEDDPLKSCVTLYLAVSINERGQITTVGLNPCESDFVITFRLDPVRKNRK